MRLRRTAAAAFGLVVLLPTLAACGGDDGGVEVGDTLPARHDDQFADGHDSYVVLPTGRLEVQLGEPVTRIAARDTRDLTAVDAPDGATFVPITWQYDAGTFMEHGDYLGDAPSPVIDVLSDGAKYRVAAPAEEGRGSESFYLLVSGSGKDPSLEIDFDGVTQTVDLTTGDRSEGRAAGLYDIKTVRKGRRTCKPAVFSGATGAGRLTCTIGAVTALPYAGGAWAEPGHVWLAFEVDTELGRYGVLGSKPGSYAAFYPVRVDTRLTVAGEEPVLDEQAGPSPCPEYTSVSCSDDHFVVVDATKKGRPKLKIDQTFDLKAYSRSNGYDGKKHLKLRAISKTPIR
ncbi:MAG TPA: hypothetical protein VNS81_03410 [Nocardioides sp.]|nr:hypothetical protein [Nocardioides sp.]